MPIKSSVALASVLGMFLLSGCGAPDVTMYEPGVYKGKQDAAASEEAAAAREGPLRERAQTSFTDR